MFNWGKINDNHFEEIVYSVLLDKKPIKIDWRTGGSDSGRDVEAVFRTTGGVGEGRNETYFIEVKHHTGGVSPDKITGALTWAHSSLPNTLIVAVSSHLTNSCRRNIEDWHKNNHKINVEIWEKAKVEQEILKSSKARRKSIEYGLLLPTITEILPPSPRRKRKSNGDFSMLYSYLTSDKKVDDLTHVMNLIENLSASLREECEKADHKYFENLSLAVPNWLTYLKLFQVETKLQFAIRDYLLSECENADETERKKYKRKIESLVKHVKKVGDASNHVD